ncbi:hypothetical protein SY88_17090 [Clostridiales bacterium PH28_bin88]|nr:hypothetical protein SY88_17090 [Clostridiales bacterium PH28_bin88]
MIIFFVISGLLILALILVGIVRHDVVNLTLEEARTIAAREAEKHIQHEYCRHTHGAARLSWVIKGNDLHRAYEVEEYFWSQHVIEDAKSIVFRVFVDAKTGEILEAKVVKNAL